MDLEQPEKTHEKNENLNDFWFGRLRMREFIRSNVVSDAKSFARRSVDKVKNKNSEHFDVEGGHETIWLPLTAYRVCVANFLIFRRRSTVDCIVCYHLSTISRCLANCNVIVFENKNKRQSRRRHRLYIHFVRFPHEIHNAVNGIPCRLLVQQCQTLMAFHCTYTVKTMVAFATADVCSLEIMEKHILFPPQYVCRVSCVVFVWRWSHSYAPSPFSIGTMKTSKIGLRCILNACIALDTLVFLHSLARSLSWERRFAPFLFFISLLHSMFVHRAHVNHVKVEKNWRRKKKTSRHTFHIHAPPAPNSYRTVINLCSFFVLLCLANVFDPASFMSSHRMIPLHNQHVYFSVNNRKFLLPIVCVCVSRFCKWTQRHVSTIDIEFTTSFVSPNVDRHKISLEIDSSLLLFTRWSLLLHSNSTATMQLFGI